MEQRKRSRTRLKLIMKSVMTDTSLLAQEWPCLRCTAGRGGADYGLISASKLLDPNFNFIGLRVFNENAEIETFTTLHVHLLFVSRFQLIYYYDNGIKKNARQNAGKTARTAETSDLTMAILRDRKRAKSALSNRCEKCYVNLKTWLN